MWPPLIEGAHVGAPRQYHFFDSDVSFAMSGRPVAADIRQAQAALTWILPKTAGGTLAPPELFILAFGKLFSKTRKAGGAEGQEVH